MTACLICLNPVSEGGDYHSRCIRNLFGTRTLPVLDLDLSKLYALAAARMAGKMSISGAQEKVSLALSAESNALEVAATGGRYILKPETSRFPSVPQNEQLTMLLAALVSIKIPPMGLIHLKDATTAYVIKRFDRTDEGGKLQVEDFCQLAQQRAKDKYHGSAELCVKLLKKYATEPLIEIQKFYRLILFCWWAANGDMHLKNFSLITGLDGIRRLSPAYDLVCTRLVLPDDTLTLPIGGRDRNLTRRKWLEFAEYCQIPERAAIRLLDAQIKSLESGLRLVSASYLPDAMKVQYAEIMRENTATLIG